MRVSELLTKLDGIEAAKDLAATIRADLGHLPEIDTKDLANAAAGETKAKEDLKKSQDQVKELETGIKALDEKAKGADALKAKVEAFENDKRGTLTATAFEKAAKENGVKPEALAAARKLADLSAVKVDLEKGEVSGIGKETFEALKKDHAFLFGDKAAPGGEASIPALPPAGPSSPAQGPTPEIGGAIGYFVKAAAR